MFEQCNELSGISIQGVMTIGPNTDDEYSVEKCFEETYELFERLQRESQSVKYLSMGMTNDYELAIKHGANVVRVGRAIFGAR